MGYQDDLYRPPPALSQGRQGGHQYHEGPPSGNPFDDPFFNNFLKGQQQQKVPQPQQQQQKVQVPQQQTTPPKIITSPSFVHQSQAPQRQQQQHQQPQQQRPVKKSEQAPLQKQ